MPIPTAIDHQLSEIEAIAAGVATALRTLRHSPGRDVGPVRERAQAYADAVMQAAHDIANDKQ
jgi:hypothetical protein